MNSGSASQRKPSVPNKPSPPKLKEPDEPKRSTFLWFALLVLFINGAWAVYHIQSESLPVPLTAQQAGKRGFAEASAMKHVKYLTGLGPHPVGSDSLDLAIEVRFYYLWCTYACFEIANFPIKTTLYLIISYQNSTFFFYPLFSFNLP
jgi:hypothetical protein